MRSIHSGHDADTRLHDGTPRCSHRDRLVREPHHDRSSRSRSRRLLKREIDSPALHGFQKRHSGGVGKNHRRSTLARAQRKIRWDKGVAERPSLLQKWRPARKSASQTAPEVLAGGIQAMTAVVTRAHQGGAGPPLLAGVGTRRSSRRRPTPSDRAPDAVDTDLGRSANTRSWA